MSVVHNAIQNVFIPPMAPVKQHLPRPVISDVPGAVREQLLKSCLPHVIHEDMKIAITCGSRGISNIPDILRVIADFCKSKGAAPFIFPAMGSHGGATAAGQTEYLAGLGITEDACGCPIVSSMDTVLLGHTPEGYPAFIDRTAYEADGIIVVGRVKAHTAFRGPYESGLMKMIAVGMGKCEGAEVCHRTGFRLIHEIIPSVARLILERANILLGLAIVENAYDETCILQALSPEEIPLQEPLLLKQAKDLMGRIYIPQTDLLIVDQIGKNISGDGSDPNIAGNFCCPYATGGLTAEKRVVLDLTEETQGNAMGVGLYDATTRRLYKKIDFEKTYINPIISTAINMVRVPLIMESDRDAIAVCLKTTPEADPQNPRIIRIRDTRHVDEIMVSPAHLAEIEAHPNMEIAGPFRPLPFGPDGNLW